MAVKHPLSRTVWCMDEAPVIWTRMPAMAAPQNPSEDAASRRSAVRFVPVALMALAAGGVLIMGWHRYLSLESLVQHRVTLDDFVGHHRLAAVASYVGVYAAAVAMSFPGAALLTIAGGILFGCWLGAALATVGAVAGATAVFLIASSAIGGALARRAGPLAERLASGFRDNAFSYLLFMRLVPVFPFWLVNLVAAVVGVRLSTFAVATLIGIIPGTIAYALLGAGLDSAVVAQRDTYGSCLASGRPDCRLDFDIGAALTPQLLSALVVLGIISLAPAIVRHVRQRRRSGAEDGP